MPPKTNRPTRSATAPKPSAKDKRRQELVRLQRAGDKARAAFEYSEANQHYERAQEFLRQGNWSGYGEEIRQLGEILKRLAAGQSAVSRTRKSAPSVQ